MSPLPAFLILGVQRGGTTSLYDYLTNHPRIVRAKRKEVHFFDLFYERGIDWYRSQFPWTLRLRRGAITGDASPYYLFHPAVPQRVAEHLPDVKLIVLLRDPVDRAFSHYQLARRRGWESLSFAEAIRAEPERLAGEAEKLFDPAYVSFNHQNLSYVARGVYIDQILAWTKHFPVERFLFMQSEDLYRDPRATFHRTLDFLGMPAIELLTYAHRNLGGYEEAIEPEVRSQLQAFYRPHNERLYDFLGVDLGWDR
jgi:hypothetical protein